MTDSSDTIQEAKGEEGLGRLPPLTALPILRNFCVSDVILYHTPVSDAILYHTPVSDVILYHTPVSDAILYHTPVQLFNSFR